MTRITKPVVASQTLSYVCDRCKSELHVNTCEYGAMTHIHHKCGYGSAWGDGALVMADICEPCLHDLIHQFAVVADPSRRTPGSLRGEIKIKSDDYFELAERASDDFMAERKPIFPPSTDTEVILLAAVELMQGDEGAALDWLNSPAEALGGASPFEHAQTTRGQYEVMDMIFRIRHGQ